MEPDYFAARNGRVPPITATLKDGSGAAVNLATAVDVRFTMHRYGDPTPKVDDALVSITNAAGGAVSYSWAAGDLDAIGLYRYRWRVNWSGGVSSYFPTDGWNLAQIT